MKSASQPSLPISDLPNNLPVSAMSLDCHRELNACFRNSECKELHNKYVGACEETIVEHAQCTQSCRSAYYNFKKVSSLSFTNGVYYGYYPTISISFTA